MRDLSLSSGQGQNGEMDVLRILLHVLLALAGRVFQEVVLAARSTVERTVLATVQLVEVAVLFDEGNEVVVDLKMRGTFKTLPP